jgi:aspartate kinase
MHARAIEIAGHYGTDVRVGSSFADEPGTLITRRPERMEELILTGIASQAGQAKLALRGLPAGMRTATAFLVALAEAGVNVDMISEAREVDGRLQLQLTIEAEQVEAARRVCEQVARGLGGGELEVQPGLTRVALVGSGMHRRPGVYARAFRALLEHEVDVFAVSTSGISITLLVQTAREEAALRALHAAFELELMDG